VAAGQRAGLSEPASSSAVTAITERSALSLARAIRGGELTATRVVGEHIALHERFAPRINAVAADRYEEAQREAVAADERIAAAAPDAEVPPLLGVPFTVKESIAVRGMPLSAGLLARRDERSGDSAPAVQRLVDAGGIPLGVTNLSELTLWIESENRVYGRTNNPYDPSRTAGGSSGGEGAAVGCGGSPFGLASDIAGSIRIPALFCGVFGHKPSSGLVPNTGLWPPTAGDSGTMLGTGPLARRAEDLMPLLRIIAGPDGQDPIARTVSLGDPAAVSLDGLTVVTVQDASVRPISTPLRDARERAVGALLAAGATVRRVQLPSWRWALPSFLAALQAGSGDDASHATLRLLAEAGEPKPTWRELLRRGGPHTAPTRVTLAAEMLRESGDQNPPRRLLSAARNLVAELTEAIGDGVMLHPVHPRTAPKHGRTFGRLWLLTPAAVFNLAGLPVTEVPLGLSEQGLPLGVQVAAGFDRDHVSIAVALELERVFGGWVPPPRP
jgi:fatty acid amide hydrolase 2